MNLGWLIFISRRCRFDKCTVYERGGTAEVTVGKSLLCIWSRRFGLLPLWCLSRGTLQASIKVLGVGSAQD